MEKFSIRDRRIIFIFLAGSVAITLMMITQYTSHENKEFEQTFDSLFIAVSLSLLGLILFVFRRLGVFAEFSESMELMLLLIIPTFSVIPLLSKQPVNLWFFGPIFFGVSIVWFLSVKYFFVQHIKKEKERKAIDSTMKLLWGMLMIFGAMFIGIFIFFIVPFFVNPPPV